MNELTTLETIITDKDGKGCVQKWVSLENYNQIEYKLKMCRSEFNLCMDDFRLAGLNIGQILKLKYYYEINSGNKSSDL